MANKQVKSELYWLKANSFKLTYDILCALHILSDHPNARTIQQEIESPVLTDFAVKLLSVLVEQTCEICLKKQLRAKRRKSRPSKRFYI